MEAIRRPAQAVQPGPSRSQGNKDEGEEMKTEKEKLISDIVRICKDNIEAYPNDANEAVRLSVFSILVELDGEGLGPGCEIHPLVELDASERDRMSTDFLPGLDIAGNLHHDFITAWGCRNE